MGSNKFLLKQKEVAEAFTSGRDALFQPATVALLPQMHFHSIDMLRRVCLSCRYGWNGEKHVICINPGRSDGSVPT